MKSYDIMYQNFKHAWYVLILVGNSVHELQTSRLCLPKELIQQELNKIIRHLNWDIIIDKAQILSEIKMLIKDKQEALKVPEFADSFKKQLEEEINILNNQLQSAKLTEQYRKFLSIQQKRYQQELKCVPTGPQRGNRIGLKTSERFKNFQIPKESQVAIAAIG